MAVFVIPSAGPRVFAYITASTDVVKVIIRQFIWVPVEIAAEVPIRSAAVKIRFETEWVAPAEIANAVIL